MYSRLAGKMKDLILVVSVLCSSQIYGLETPEQSEQSHPRYAFNYGVRDYNTGDIKDHWEVRKGDAVKGSYSLVEADGTVRTVEYSADKRRGFRAVVSKTSKKSHIEKGGQRNAFRRPLEGTRLEWRLPEVHSLESRGSVPSNHRPEYAGIADYKSLFDRYKSFRETTSNTKKQKFDYGINEYMAKRVRGRKPPEEVRRKISRS